MSGEGSCPSMGAPNDAQRDEEELMLKDRMDDIGHKLLVMSGKGGVGKSTVAANLAVSLAAEGMAVGLLDVDIHGPSIPTLMGLAGKRPGTVNNGLLPVEVTQNLKVMSIGFMLDSTSDAVIWRGPMKYNVIRQFLKDVAWGRLDYLVIDSPPGTGDEPLAVAQLVGQPASAVIVTTPQDLAIADVRRSVSFCNTLSLPVAGIVENMSGLVCPHCDETIDLFGTGGGAALAAEMNVPMLGQIPLDPQVVAAGDEGTPFIQRCANTPSAKAMDAIVEKLLMDTENPTPQAAPADAPQAAQVDSPNGKISVALPLVDGKLCTHFGHCQQFAIFTVSRGDKQITGKQLLTPPAHEPGVLPRWLEEQGVTLVIAGGMGQRAQQLFTDSGITVLTGAPVDEPEALLTAYLNDALVTAENVCDH
jgi:ATP-binding protein involved in chromosome partitioning